MTFEITPTAFTANPIAGVTFGDLKPTIEVTVTKINTSYRWDSIFIINGIQFGY